MRYLKTFKLLNDYSEYNLIKTIRSSINRNNYPFHLFTYKQLERLEFDDITIFYGDNGSGKSTLLSIIASKLGASRKTNIYRSEFFNAYVNGCFYDMGYDHPKEVKVITSDDVFQHMLSIRTINERINFEKTLLDDEYHKAKNDRKHININDYDKIKSQYEARNNSSAEFIRKRLKENDVPEQSNGETALMFWEKEIDKDAIYILDEPENSLSAVNQVKLKEFIEVSVRFYNCQFIISTHSPFLLALQGAKIYNLDERPVKEAKWEELPNVKAYYNLIKENEDKFSENVV